MGSYSFLHLTNGKTAWIEDVECPSVEIALALAREIAGEEEIEIRKNIGRVNPRVRNPV